MAQVGFSPDQTKRAADRYETLARSLFQLRGLADPGGDRIARLVHSAMAGATTEELRSADGISAATIGRLDQLITSAVEADRPRNIHSAEAARLAQLGEQGGVAAIGAKAHAELKRATEARAEARERADRGEAVARGERYGTLPAAGDKVSSTVMGAYVQQYAGAGLGRGTVQTFAEIGLQRDVYDTYRKEGFSQQDIGEAAKTTKTLGWKNDRQAFDDVQRSSKPERAAIVEIHREKDEAKRGALIETKRRELHIDDKPQATRDRWQRNMDRDRQHHHDSDLKRGVGTSAKQVDASLVARRVADQGKVAAAKVRVAKLETSRARSDVAQSAAQSDDFGVSVTPTLPTKVAVAKPAANGPQAG